MFYLMEHVAWLTTVFVVSAMVLFFVCFHAFVLRFQKHKKGEYEIASIITHLIGMLYAVLLGFIAVSTWGNFDHAVENAKAEENAIADLYRLSGDFPEDVRERIRNDILQYATLMPKEEWPAMQHGGQTQEGYLISARIAEAIDELEPKSLHESNIQIESLSLLHSFLDARRARIDKNHEGMPVMLWWTLLIGATIMIGFTFSLRQTNRLHQLFMTGVLAALVGLLFSLILEFEYPFRGAITVSSTEWTKLVENIESNQFY